LLRQSYNVFGAVGCWILDNWNGRMDGWKNGWIKPYSHRTI